jgi:hypothetical protein
MDHQKVHLFEKIQVQLLTVALGLVVFFGLWPLIAPDDRHAPLTLLAGKSILPALLVLVAGALLSFLAGLATLHHRPVSGPMVGFLPLLALSFRSEKINVLLYHQSQGPGSAFGALIGELIFLLLVAGVCALAAGIGRELLGRVKPPWRWKSPSSDPGADLLVSPPRRWLGVFAPPVEAMDKSAPGTARNRTQCIEGLKAAGIALLVAQAVFLLLCRSDERGQLLFAVGVGFLAGSLAAQLLCPSHVVAPLLVLPIVSGAFYYAYAMVVTPRGLHAWTSVPLPARVLPVDWLSAGVGGVLTGYWIACRIRETKVIEAAQSADPTEA